MNRWQKTITTLCLLAALTGSVAAGRAMAQGGDKKGKDKKLIVKEPKGQPAPDRRPQPPPKEDKQDKGKKKN